MEILINEDAQTYRVKRPSTGKDEPDDTIAGTGKTENPKFSGYKLAVVLLGLQCVVLLTVIIGLYIKTTKARHQADFIHTEQKHQALNLTEEQDQLQTILNNLGREKSHLQTQYNILRNKTSQTEARCNTLSKEKDELEKLFTNHNGTKDKQQLQDLYNNLKEEKKQLQCRFNNITREMYQLQTQYTILKNKTSQTEAQRDELEKYFTKHESMMTIKKQAVNVILDPDTAHVKLILSADGKQVRHGDIQLSVPDRPQRFSPVVNVLARNGFSSGRFYYEVQVKGKTDWALGVASESIPRKGLINLSPEVGFWTIWLRNGAEYTAKDSPPVPLSVKEKPLKVGVFVDYEAGQVSFYDADSWDHLYSYTNATFTETLYPYFSPFANNKGKNLSPLVITPVCPW